MYSNPQYSSPTRARGFSLIELMMVMAILTVVMAGIFGIMSSAQKRYAVEDSKVDLTQESREFLDQVMRDLHQAGFPNARMYAVTPPNGANSDKIAVGLVRVSHSDIIFEGDTNGDGVVRVIRYTLDSSENSGSCPCTLKRSEVNKVDGALPDDQPTNYSAEVERVLNSYGAGNSPLSIAGTTFNTSNNTTYATFKAAPVFQFFDQDGVVVTGVPNDLTTSGTGNDATMLSRIRSVRFTIHTMSPVFDVQLRSRPTISMTSSAVVINSR